MAVRLVVCWPTGLFLVKQLLFGTDSDVEVTRELTTRATSAAGAPGSLMLFTLDGGVTPVAGSIIAPEDRLSINVGSILQACREGTLQQRFPQAHSQTQSGDGEAVQTLSLYVDLILPTPGPLAPTAVAGTASALLAGPPGTGGQAAAAQGDGAGGPGMGRRRQKSAPKISSGAKGLLHTLVRAFMARADNGGLISKEAKGDRRYYSEAVTPILVAVNQAFPGDSASEVDLAMAKYCNYVGQSVNNYLLGVDASKGGNSCTKAAYDANLTEQATWIKEVKPFYDKGLPPACGLLAQDSSLASTLAAALSSVKVPQGAPPGERTHIQPAAPLVLALSDLEPTPRRVRQLLPPPSAAVADFAARYAHLDPEAASGSGAGPSTGTGQELGKDPKVAKPRASKPKAGARTDPGKAQDAPMKQKRAPEKPAVDEVAAAAGPRAVKKAATAAAQLDKKRARLQAELDELEAASRKKPLRSGRVATETQKGAEFAAAIGLRNLRGMTSRSGRATEVGLPDDYKEVEEVQPERGDDEDEDDEGDNNYCSCSDDSD